MRKSSFKALLLTAAVGVAGVAAAQQPAQRPISPSRQGLAVPGRENTPNGGRPEIRSVEEMRKVGGYTSPGGVAYSDLAAEAGGKMWPVTLYYRCKNTPGGTSIKAPAPQAIEVFDNVFSVGDHANNIWALKTPEGIILLDALSNEADAKTYIVEGFRKLGLDPKDIKYILVTHNHGDHYGGVPYLKSLSGAKVGMSQLDWDVPPRPGSWPVKGPDDFYITDGGKITLGGLTVTTLITGGHTPGTVSFLFPVSDKGVPHMASLFGGQGSPDDVRALLNFRQALQHFADYTDLMQADVVLSNHTVGDDGLTKVAQLANRKPGEPNPYVVGREGVIRYDAEWRACLSADIDERVRAGKTYDPQRVGVPLPPPPVRPAATPAAQ